MALVSRVSGTALFLFLVLTSSAADQPGGGWLQHRVSAKGDQYIPIKECHPLRYYSEDPFRFDYEGDYSLADHKTLKVYTDTRFIEKIEGSDIYDVVHAFYPKASDRTWVKMVLLERAKGEFCEIYHLTSADTVTVLKPSFVVEHGRYRILATRCPVRGTGGFVYEDYYLLGGESPIALDIKDLIQQRLKAMLPPGRGVRRGSGFNVKKMCYALPVWQTGNANSDPTGGFVFLKFGIRDNALVATDGEYDPNPRHVTRAERICPTIE